MIKKAILALAALTALAAGVREMRADACVASIEPIKPVKPVGCKDQELMCVCDSHGQNCKKTWVCIG